jgi:putative effector of murein hydrolase LrgA (UPF0299 family)
VDIRHFLREKQVVPHFRGFAILVAFSQGGALVARHLPVAIPGAIVGFLALFFAMALRLVSWEWVHSTATLLARQLGLFFLPGAVLATRDKALHGVEAARFVVACVVGQLVVFWATAALHSHLIPPIKQGRTK